MLGFGKKDKGGEQAITSQTPENETYKGDTSGKAAVKGFFTWSAVTGIIVMVPVAIFSVISGSKISKDKVGGALVAAGIAGLLELAAPIVGGIIGAVKGSHKAKAAKAQFENNQQQIGVLRTENTELKSTLGEINEMAKTGHAANVESRRATEPAVALGGR